MHRPLYLLGLISSLYLIAAAPPPNYDKKQVLTALAKWSDHTIAKQLTHCEVNGSVEKKDGTYISNSVKVRDVFVKHVLWSQKDSDVKVQGFECESADDDKPSKNKNQLSCRWWFGEKENPKTIAWSVSLLFPYNPQKNEVKAAEIQCVQVP